MNKNNVILPEIKLVGITKRTSNSQESDSTTAIIGKTMQEFFSTNMQEKTNNKKNPNTIFSAYTNYESDFTGEYTYFIGQEVTSFIDIPNEFTTLNIPPQNYIKFTACGNMPNIVIDAWQKIWAMNDSELGGKRSYITDFEIYDERSFNPKQAIVDIYIGIK